MTIAAHARHLLFVIWSLVTWPSDFIRDLFGFESIDSAELEVMAAERFAATVNAAFEDYRRAVHGYAPNGSGTSTQSRSDDLVHVACLDCLKDRVLFRGACSKCGSHSWTPKGRVIDARYKFQDMDGRLSG